MKRKQWMSLLLAVAMAVSMLPVGAFADEANEAVGGVQPVIVTEQEKEAPQETEKEPAEKPAEEPAKVSMEASAEGPAQEQSVSTVVEIKTSQDLVNAIKNQQNGQTWIFMSAGEFNADPAPNSDVYAEHFYKQGDAEGFLPDGSIISGKDDYSKDATGFVFPIYVDDLTITKADGVGEVIITSTARPNENDGNWPRQAFMIVSGSGVTIQNVTLQGNRSEYANGDRDQKLQGNQCDKTLETVQDAGDLTLRNVNIPALECEAPSDLTVAGTKRSGSLYFSHAFSADKTVTLENVYTYGGIKSANDVNILLNGVTENFVDNTYASYYKETANYAWNPGVRGGTVGDLDNVTVGEGGFFIITGSTMDPRQIFNESLVPGTTIRLEGDMESSSTVELEQSVVLDLNGHTIFAGDDFDGEAEQPHLINIAADDVTVKNGTFETSAASKHGVNVYRADRVVLEDLTIDHSAAVTGAPLVVNGSRVAVSGELHIITSGESWHGINVDTTSADHPAALIIADKANVSFDGTLPKETYGIKVESGEAAVTLSFGENSVLDCKPVGMIPVWAAEGATVQDPENAGLQANDDGTFTTEESLPGEGTEQSPYLIGTLDQLRLFRDMVNSGEEQTSGKYYKLTANIDLGGEEWTPIGGVDTGKKFAGTFDGDGHTISNLKITRANTNDSVNNSVGFFGACANGNATLKNFTLNNVDVQGCLNVAAVLGGSGGAEASITNVHVTGSVRVSGWWYVGGILGKGYSKVTDCSVEGDGVATSGIAITGGYAGGIVGFMGEENCVTDGCTVKNISVSGAYNGIGGVNGILHYGNTIKNCKLENVVVWQTTDPEEDGRIYVGAFAGTYLDDNGKKCPTLENNTFQGELYSGKAKNSVLEASRYVGSLWYGAEPPATVNVENCTIVIPAPTAKPDQGGSEPAATPVPTATPAPAPTATPKPLATARPVATATPAPTEAPVVTDGTVVATTTADAVVENATAVATVESQQLAEAVETAVSEADAVGAAPVVQVEIARAEGAEAVEVTLPADALTTLAARENAELIVTSDVARVAFDSAALSAITQQATEQVVLSVSPVAHAQLNEAQAAVVSDFPVVELTLRSGDEVISDFSAGNATVTLPYTLADDQQPEGVVVWYVDDNGGTTPCDTVYNEGEGLVTFITPHFSRYAIAYDETLVPAAPEQPVVTEPAPEAEKGGLPVMPMAIGAIVVVLLVLVVVLRLLFKRRDDEQGY